MKGMWVGYDVGCTMGLTLGHGAWERDRPSNGSMWNSYSFQPVGQWMGYLFTDLGAEGCCRSLNALFNHMMPWWNRKSTWPKSKFKLINMGLVSSGWLWRSVRAVRWTSVFPRGNHKLWLRVCDTGRNWCLHPRSGIHLLDIWENQWR